MLKSLRSSGVRAACGCWSGGLVFEANKLCSVWKRHELHTYTQALVATTTCLHAPHALLHPHAMFAPLPPSSTHLQAQQSAGAEEQVKVVLLGVECLK